MKKCTVKLTAAVLLLSVIAASFCGCSLTAYTVEELECLAVDCGLQIAAVYGEDSFSPLQPEDARGVMVLLKK